MIIKWRHFSFHPHPDPLPTGEGKTSSMSRVFVNIPNTEAINWFCVILRFGIFYRKRMNVIKIKQKRIFMNCISRFNKKWINYSATINRTFDLYDPAGKDITHVFSVRQRLFLSRCLCLTRTPFYMFFIMRQDWYHILLDVEDAIPYILDDETFFRRMSAPHKLGGMSRTPSPTF